MTRLIDSLLAALPWGRGKHTAVVLVATTRGPVAVPADRLGAVLRRP